MGRHGQCGLPLFHQPAIKHEDAHGPLEVLKGNMRLAFVLQLGEETRPAEGLLEGWVEEVDSCIQCRFHSTEELLKFFGQRCEAAGLRGEKQRSELAVSGKKAARKSGRTK